MKLKKTLLMSLFSFIFVGNAYSSATNAEKEALEDLAFNLAKDQRNCNSLQGNKKAQCLEKVAKKYERHNPALIAYLTYELGTMYGLGKEVKQDFKKSFYWLHKSAEGGVDIAQNIIGQMYYSGKGTKQDYQKALYWYKKAAEQGQASAMRGLGMMYMMGEGVKQNDKQAVYWFEKACSAGDQKICQLINNAKPRQ